jgi:transcriptional regulator with XRE-family HTH domain
MYRLKTIRTERGISQQELATALDVGQNTVSQWEKGTRKPDFVTLEALANYFEVSVDWLLGRTEIKSYGHLLLEGDIKNFQELLSSNEISHDVKMNVGATLAYLYQILYSPAKDNDNDYIEQFGAILQNILDIRGVRLVHGEGMGLKHEDNFDEIKSRVLDSLDALNRIEQPRIKAAIKEAMLNYLKEGDENGIN